MQNDDMPTVFAPPPWEATEEGGVLGLRDANGKLILTFADHPRSQATMRLLIAAPTMCGFLAHTLRRARDLMVPLEDPKEAFQTNLEYQQLWHLLRGITGEGLT